jgi:hypothetical protein
MGGYDDLKAVPKQDVDCDLFCFADADLPARAGDWRVVRVRRRPAIHPRMRAKYFKLLSHRVFPGGRLALRFDPMAAFGKRPRYDATLWIDGSIRIKSKSFVREFLSGIGNSGWVLFPHPDRDCIFEEAEVSLTMEKYRGLPLEEQVRAYGMEGVQPHSGLYACTIIGRQEPLSAPLQALNESWWAENWKWSYQDQLSLPYLLSKLRLGVDTVDKNLWRNDWFDWVAHHTEA